MKYDIPVYTGANRFDDMRKMMEMMTYRYRVFEELSFNPDIGHYHTYGIELTTGDSVTDRISDVSVCQTEAERLAAGFTRHQLFPAHFHDAVEDMLTGMRMKSEKKT